MTQIRITSADRTWSSETPRVFTIGRDVSCDIGTEEPSVSRRHAEIRFEAGQWVLIDLGSSHGTWVNGQRVPRAPLSGEVTAGFGAQGQGLTLTITVAAETQVAGTPPAPVASGAFPPPPVAARPVGAVPGPGAPAGPGALGQTVVAGGPNFAGGPGLLIRRRHASDLRFPFGTPVRIGRDPQFEVVAEDPAVSRLHAVLEPRPDGWTWVDRSTSGTFIDGERITQFTFDRPTEVCLGHPTAGFEIEVVPVVDPHQAVANIERRKRRRTLAVVGASLAALLVLGGLAVGGFVLVDKLNGDDDKRAVDPNTENTTVETSDAGLSDEELNRAKRATVLLTAFDSSDTPMWSGSGSIITEDGLILTNAHVGAPNAPGQGSGADLAYLTVSLTSDNDAAPAQAVYRANPIVADGYLDLAVLQINATADGGEVDLGDLDLPEPLPLGDSDEVRTGDHIVALGYPAIGNVLAAGDRPLTVTEGVVSTFQADPIVGTERGAIDSDVRLGSGNSGGPSINEDGEIIGLNTRVVTADSMAAGAITQGSALIVPVNLAEAILDVAADGGNPDYVSPYLQDVPDFTPGDIDVVAAGWSPESEAGACDGTDLGGAPDFLPASAGDLVGAEFLVSGIPDGVPVAIEFYTLDGATRLDSISDTWDRGPEQRCSGAGLTLPEGLDGAIAAFYVGDSTTPVAQNPVQFG